MDEIKRVHFIDEGQDFLFFDVEVKTGRIVDVKPFQYSIWSKFTVLNINSIEIRGRLCIREATEKPVYIIHPVSLIEVVEQEDSK